MLSRIAIIDFCDNKGGHYVHTDPSKGPPRHDLRKPRSLPDPDLSRDMDMHDPDLDESGV